MNKYTIEHWPKFKAQEIARLSLDQREVRRNQSILLIKHSKICKNCNKEQSIEEYYIKDRKTKRRSSTCRDCCLKKQGVLEVGKQRFANKILGKGFRRCSICKNIQPLCNFTKNKKIYGGHVNTCKECNYKLTREYIKGQAEKVGLFYIKQYAKREYGETTLDENKIKHLKNEIKRKRKPKYFLDDKSFLNATDFARYLDTFYQIPIYTTIKRLEKGCTEEECLISEYDLRSMKLTKGAIKVTDTITGEIFMFKNTREKGLLEMFSTATITRCLKTGGITKVIKSTKYKNPCKIERL